MTPTPLQAMVRFGLGRRGGESLPSDPVAWLEHQVAAPDPVLAVAAPSGGDGLAALRDDRRMPSADGNQARGRAMMREGTASYIDTLLTTDMPFRERLVAFWTNHFTISLRRGEVAGVLHAYVREAIRPHVNGRFGDMLLAVMRHPGMLLYLDNAQSFGPDSPVGQRQKRGLNENMARECLELHTVTPASGYTQADVTQFAAILTGWALDLNANPPGFVFRPNVHQPGSKMLMGNTYPQGQAAGEAALAWLAAHPATYRNLATKLVRHFVADVPPPAVVDRIATVLRDTGGDLKAASLALVHLPEAWQPMTKLRNPADYVVAVYRALDLPADKRGDVQGIMSGLGQPLLNAPLPNGWPDTAPDWAGSEAMLRRVDWAYSVSGRAGALDPVEVAGNAVGPLLPATTLEQIRRAGSRREAMTMLLASPEFQRR
jgi:uncharacterized protein (DUF1800 family)